MNPIVRKNVNKLEFQVKKTLALLVLACALVASACGSTPEMTVGVVYAQHPKADIVVKSEPHGDHSSFIVCDSTNSQMYLVRVETSNGAYLEEDLIIPNTPCGAQLKELQRLAEIGKKHDNKN